MAIITVSRELAALGDETAKALADQLNYRYVNKSTMEERIKSFGVSNNKFSRYDEKKPSFLASFSHDRDIYLHHLRSAVLFEAGMGSTVFIGRGTGVILKNVPGVFSVFLVAPPEIRINRVMSYYQCDEKRAKQIICQSDQDRIGFHRYFFDVNWQDAGNYHLTLNTGHLHPDVCAEIVKHLRDRIMTEEAEAQCMLRIKELALEQKIRHYLLYELNIPIHFLEADVKGSQVFLYGVTNDRAVIESAVSHTRELAPSSAIHSEIQVVQEYNIMH